jgi:hypothetical protein
MMTLVNPVLDDVKQAVPTGHDLSVAASAATGFAAGKGIRIGVDALAQYLPAAVQPYFAMKAVGVSLGDAVAALATLMGANFVFCYVLN